VTLFDPVGMQFVPEGRLEPVMIEVVRECHFKAKGAEEVKGRTVKRRGCARCGQPKNAREHMGQPPSINPLGSGDPMAYQGLKQQWQSLIVHLLRLTDLPRPCAHILVEGEVTFPTRAKRDQGNFRFLIEKALGDALIEGGWLVDDDWDSYEFGNLTKSYERGVSATRLVLFPTLP
jgi:hypothetical protein